MLMHGAFTIFHMIPDYTIVGMLFLYLLVLVLLSSLKPVYISFRRVYLFRCLFPSWRFYEDLSYIPVLYYRESNNGLDFDSWKPACRKIERKWSRIFINPEGNLAHACNSLLQQLESDKEEVTDEDKNLFINSVSYRLCRNLVESLIIPEGKKFYQFKLTLEKQGSTDDTQDILFSITHEAS
jgi:hypothetical protein